MKNPLAFARGNRSGAGRLKLHEEDHHAAEAENQEVHRSLSLRIRRRRMHLLFTEDMPIALGFLY